MVEEMVVEKGGVGGWCWPAKKGGMGCSCWLLLAEKGRRKELMKEREDGSVYIYIKELIYLQVATPLYETCVSSNKWAASLSIKSASGKREADAEMGFASKRKTRVLRLTKRTKVIMT